jgi:predicted nucleotidyltransferase
MDVSLELSLDSIQQRLRQRRDLLRQQYRITEMGIFGSYARGEQTVASDVDVLVDYEQAPTLAQLVELRNYLSDLMGKKVDVVTKRGDVIDSDQVFNRLAAILAESEALEPQTDEVEDYAPQTALGQQLWSIRQHAVAAGMPLQSAEAIAEEIGAERKRF